MPVSISSGARTISVFWFRVLFSIVVEPGSLVRLVHELHRVANAQRDSGKRGARADVHLAAGIAGGQYTGIGFPDVVQLFFQDALRHVWLEQVVDAGGAATPFAAIERDKV